MNELHTYDNYKNFFNRELSWLEFNQRVLDEAKDNTNPLLERLKFLAISSSNLDEFFMVRVGSLYSQIQAGFDEREVSGLTPGEQIEKILEKVRIMVKDQYITYEHLYDRLGVKNLRILNYNMMNEEQLKFVNEYYKNILYPVLTPMVIDSGRPFPLLSNKTLNIGVILKSNKSGQEVFATIQVPSVLDRLVPIPGENGENFILLEDVIKNHLSELFGFKVLTTACYRVTKNADLSLNEEGAEDLLETIEESLKQRRWGVEVRLEIEQSNDNRIINILEQEFEISENQIFEIKGPIDLTFCNKLYNVKGYSELKFEQVKSLAIKELQEDIFQAISKNDIFLHHPYESFSSVVKLVETAAKDEKVLAIKQTLYRVSGNSPIIAALSKAAENGKQVTVLVELKARFDEENNIHWARQLEKAGCHVIYGVIGLKTHSKILLIVRQEKKGIKRYVHLGTGNYNDVTAKFYTDIGILTSKPEYGEDATVIFNMLSGYFKPENMSKITIAPYRLRKKLEHLIERETEYAKSGKKAKIIAKMNSLVDKKLMIALYKASQAGVKVQLIVRGICCLKPGIKGLSETITVKSIVGRYLEHSRIYYFHNEGKEDIYISSADWMYRNLDKRVETMTIIEDSMIKRELKEMLELYLKDNVKSRILNTDGSYSKVVAQDKIVNAQEEMMELCKKYNKKK
ncbi:RNA degradosome polyphosphate kinase [Clostridium saccharoperbutylacetonicum]|uniref:RNA degradosome polyphosphate kinase n=1 Tax=Clostridium saccharoperbutylacetonicum TaxID=36745 RepID=UPI000983C2DB|nr:RNA degradosome polyphosphate kinase [Clostridium saccharoperbutylacetonicum]AQR96596.1 polyphosphate kinase [Clostridium saccharoperbutylacetonicum]NSB32472.1 polyphosphate kinase [Clostridium saccharoperbutylacetonicum]